MKPVKNRIYCPDCGRAKMLFDTEEKALRFIEYNTEEILQNNAKAPVRAYYCNICNGWHITSLEHTPSYEFSPVQLVVLSSQTLNDMEAYLTKLKQAESLQVGLLYIAKFINFVQEAKSIKEISLESYERIFLEANKSIRSLTDKQCQLIKSSLNQGKYKEAINLVDSLCELLKISHIEEIIGEDKIALEHYIKNRIKDIEEKISPKQNSERLKKTFGEKLDLANKLIEYNYISDAIKIVEELTDIIETMKEEGIKKDSVGFYKHQVKQIIKVIEEKLKAQDLSH